MGTVVHATSDLRFQGFRRLSRRQGSRLRRAGRFSARIPSQLHDSNLSLSSGDPVLEI